MLSEEITRPLRVGCECGKWLVVEPHQAGSATTCTCGRRVVVPTLEEFRERSDLPSAVTIERRVARMIAAGELPPSLSCARCEAASAAIIPIRLECERYTARSGGGERLILLPLFPLLFWMYQREEKWVEIRGRDTNVLAPMSLCEPCRQHFRKRSIGLYWLMAALSVAIGIMIGFANAIAGIAFATSGILSVQLVRWFRRRTVQRELKHLLRSVPVYREVLGKYPRAVVMVPPESATTHDDWPD